MIIGADNGFDVIMGAQGVFLGLLWAGKRSVFGGKKVESASFMLGWDQPHLYLAMQILPPRSSVLAFKFEEEKIYTQ